MKFHGYKAHESESQSASNSMADKSAGSKPALQLQDNRQQSAIQKKRVDAMADVNLVQRKKDNVGLPYQLKTNIESPHESSPANMDGEAKGLVVQRALRIAGTVVTDRMITTRNLRYKRKLDPVLSEEAPKAHYTPVQIRNELVKMAQNGNYEFSTRKEAVIAAIGRITGVSAAEDTLFGAMHGPGDAFAGFPKSETWRMLMDGKHQNKRGKYGFENEKGYMAALMNAYTHMLSNLGDELTVASYEQLHDLAIHNVTDRKGEAMDKGFRNSEFHGEGFGVDEDTWSEAGYAELKDKYTHRSTNPVGRVLAEDPEDMVGGNVKNKIVKLQPLVASQCRRFAGVVINEYHEEIERAVTADDRLLAIARCCQDLDQLHLFVDGNIRTIAFLVLNKLLLQNHLSPVILDEPNIFDCKSVGELREAIKRGQTKFQSYKG